jgi:L,D-transpeptidase ErfK/SrfK
MMRSLFLAIVMAIAWRGGSPASLIGSVADYVTADGDTLRSIGARFGVDAAVLARDNGSRLEARLAPGTRLTIDNRHLAPPVHRARGVVINVAQRMLFVFDDERPVRGFPVAVGRADWRTPLGHFEVAVKEIDPTWDVPVSIQHEMAQKRLPVVTTIGPGPENPLGDRWLGLNAGSIGLHGTNSPASIYRSTTHGCIRLHPDDIAELFGIVDVGTTVDIVYEPVIVATDELGTTYLEVHRDPYRIAGPAVTRVNTMLSEAGFAGLIGTAQVRAVISERAGRAVVIAAENVERERFR